MSVRLRVARYRLPLGSGVRTAQSAWSERSGLLLTLAGPRGELGQGEAAPLPNYSDEGLDLAERELRSLDSRFVEALLERLPEHLDALAACARLAAPSARFALETALLDWVARGRSEPVHRLLGRAWPRREPRAIALCALCTLNDANEQSRAALDAGFSSVKLKLGAPGHASDELARLTALRAALGPDVALRLDANGAWSTARAEQRLAELAPLLPEFIEEPTAQGETPVVGPAIPVALDESLRRAPLPSPAALSQRKVVALVLKPTVLGGWLRTLELAARADELGLEVVLSHTFEGPVAFAALGELGLYLGPSRFAQGLGPHAALEAWSCAPAANLGRAELVVHDEPGLGLGPAPIEPPAS